MSEREPLRNCEQCLEEIHPDDPDVVLAAKLVDVTAFGAEARERQWGKLYYFHRDHSRMAITRGHAPTLGLDPRACIEAVERRLEPHGRKSG